MVWGNVHCMHLVFKYLNILSVCVSVSAFFASTLLVSLKLPSYDKWQLKLPLCIKWIFSLKFSEYQGTPCLEQVQYMKFQRLQWDSNLVSKWTFHHLTVCFYHVTYVLSKSTLYRPVWLNGWVLVYELVVVDSSLSSLTVTQPFSQIGNFDWIK